MRALVAYFIKYPVAVNIIMAIFFIFGYFAYTGLNSTFFPVTESRTIAIQVVYPGASPEEIEEGVVIKIEDNLKGLEGVERVTSVSKENAANITVEVLKEYDANLVVDDVRNAIDQIPSYPDGMEPVVAFVQQFNNFTISFGLSGENVDLQTLKRFARKVEDDMRGMEGVSQIAISGYPEEEIEIAVDENSMRAYRLTFDQIAGAVRGSNLRSTGGTIKGNEEELLIRVNEKVYTADEMNMMVVKTTEDGAIIRLRDVATVRDRWADNPNRTLINGNPGVEITVSNTNSEDILQTADVVNAYLADFNVDNDVIQATVIRDQAVTLNERRDLLVENGLIGIALVLVLLSLFLHPSLALWVAASLPVSFFGMFILANYFDVTINVISLFGMIVVIGILVDDGIVVGENIYYQYEKGKNPIQAAIDGIMEVLPAVTSALLTTIIAFSSFFFLDGRSGDFFSEMSIVVVGTLVISLIEVIIILPSHIAHSSALKVSKKGKSALERFGDGVIGFLRERLYQPSLRFALRNKWLTLAIMVGLFMITMGAFSGGFIRATYFPNIERENVEVQLKMPSGTSERITMEKLDYIESKVWQVSEEMRLRRDDSLNPVKTIVKKLGPTIDQGSLNIILISSELREMSSFELTNVFRETVGPIYTAENLSFGTASPFGKPVSVSLLGNDLEELVAAKDELKTQLNDLSDVRDVIDTDQQGFKEVNLRLKDKAHLLGLNLREVTRQVRQGFYGEEVQRLQRGLDEVKVWVRYDENYRSSLSRLEDMRIRTSSGASYPLSEIADYNIARGTIEINHLNARREIRVEADLAGADVSATDINATIQEAILPPILQRYPSVSASFEGQNREAQKTQKSAGKVMPVILILILAIVTFTFRSLGQTLVIFLLIPFSFIGVSWGHFLHGMPLSIFSYLGIIALIGIIVNDSLVLVSKMNNFLKEGLSFEEAVYEAGMVRFRAIFLTSLTTIAGLAPLMLEKSFQAQFLIPMAVAVSYGIAIATVITLIMLPVMLVLKNELKRRFHWAWNWAPGRPLPTPESMESAVKERYWEQLQNEKRSTNEA